ncbi:MAG: hypothetical protein F4X22_06725, partial [Gemmatimonadales bacterium]|nr:hypothetical protein [Candidatus Palauibacter denitrificans]
MRTAPLRRTSTGRALPLGLIAVLFSAASLAAQDVAGIVLVEPFKVGTFAIRDIPRVGLVLRDAFIVDIELA